MFESVEKSALIYREMWSILTVSVFHSCFIQCDKLLLQLIKSMQLYESSRTHMLINLQTSLQLCNPLHHEASFQLCLQLFFFLIFIQFLFLKGLTMSRCILRCNVIIRKVKQNQHWMIIRLMCSYNRIVCIVNRTFSKKNSSTLCVVSLVCWHCAAPQPPMMPSPP